MSERGMKIWLLWIFINLNLVQGGYWSRRKEKKGKEQAVKKGREAWIRKGYISNPPLSSITLPLYKRIFFGLVEGGGGNPNLRDTDFSEVRGGGYNLSGIYIFVF